MGHNFFRLLVLFALFAAATAAALFTPGIVPLTSLYASL